MITKIAVRVCLIIAPVIGGICLIAVWIGTHIPTTRVVAYLYHLEQNKHTFGISDIQRRVTVYAPVPFQSEWDVFFSPNGTRALMTLDFYNQIEFYMLDLTTYALTRFPLGYNTCSPPRETIRWSPDSRHVSFHCRPNTVDARVNGLHLWDTDSNTIQRLHNPSNFQVMPYAWSPTGDYISLIDNNTLFLVSIPSGRSQAIPTTSSNYLLMNWSPNGEKLAIGKADKLLVYDVASQNITPAPIPSFASEVYWSPDSQWLALILQDSGFYMVKTWDIINDMRYDIGTNRHPMNSVVDLRWSDDSLWLVAQEDVNQATRLARVVVSSRDGTEAYHVVSDGRYPRWIPNTQTITYNISQIERLRYGRDLVMVSLDNIKNEQLASRVLARDALTYTWLTDGQLLTWRSRDRYGRLRELLLMPPQNQMAWSLFPNSYNVNSFAVWD